MTTTRRAASPLVPVLVAFSVVGLTVFAWLVANTHGGNVDLWLLGFGLIAIALYPLVIEWHKGAFDLFNIRNAFLTLYVITYSGWLFWLLLTDKYYMLGSVEHEHDLYRSAMIMACVGLIAFQTGYALNVGSFFAKRINVAKEAFSAVGVRSIALVLVVAGLASFLVMANMNGGVLYFVTHLWQFHAGTEELGYAPLLFGVSLAGTGFLIWYAYLGHRSTVRAPLFLGGVFLLGLVAANRMAAAATFVSAMVVYHYTKRRIVLKSKYLPIAALALALFILACGIYTRYRDYALTAPSGIAALDRSLTAQGLFQDSWQTILSREMGVEILARAMDFSPRDVPYSGILPQVEWLATFYVPHSLLPDKPEAPNFVFDHLYATVPFQSPLGGPATPLDAEAYWMGGPIAVIALCLLSGIFCKFMYSWLTRARSRAVILIYAMAFVYVMLVNEGLDYYAFGLLSEIPLLVLLPFVRQRVPGHLQRASLPAVRLRPRGRERQGVLARDE